MNTFNDTNVIPSSKELDNDLFHDESIDHRGTMENILHLSYIKEENVQMCTIMYVVA